jgi:hypothetical protein
VPIDPSILADNAEQLRRLESFVAGTSDLNHDLGGGWTVAVALAHLAFWDRRAVLLLQRWATRDVAPDDPDDDILNRALVDEWRELPPRRAAAMAVDAAREVNAAVRELAPETFAAVQARDDLWLLHRGNHRREHLDQIEGAMRRGRQVRSQ